MLFVPQLLPGQAVCWERVGSQEPMAPGLCLPPVQAGPLGIAPSPQPTAALMRQVTPPPPTKCSFLEGVRAGGRGPAKMLGAGEGVGGSATRVKKRVTLRRGRMSRAGGRRREGAPTSFCTCSPLRDVCLTYNISPGERTDCQPGWVTNGTRLRHLQPDQGTEHPGAPRWAGIPGISPASLWHHRLVLPGFDLE